MKSVFGHRPLMLLALLSLAWAGSVPAAEPAAELRESIDRLVAQLDARSLAARQQAEEALLKIGLPALPALAEARQSANIEIRRRAATVFAAINVRRVPEADVHAVGVYESGADDGRVVVRIESAARPIVLVVCARDAVHWDIRLGKGVELVKVIASGHHPQKVLGIDAVVQSLSVEGDVPADVRNKAFYAYLKPSILYDQMCERVKELTGKELSSFRCRYDAGGKPFVIGVANP